jgi:tight adherence protein B
VAATARGAAAVSAMVGTVAAGFVVAVAVGEGGRWRLRGFVDRSSDTRGPGGPGAAHRLLASVMPRALALLRPADPSLATQDMVSFLDAVGRGLRSGLGVHAAVRAAVPSSGVHGDGLASLVGSLDAGVPLAAALARWRGRRPSPEVSLAAAVLGFGLATGGSVARAVDGAAATLREQLALVGEARVLATQAKASAVVVGGAPVAFTAVVVLADPRVAAVLFGSWLGLCCLLVGGLLELACVGWMRRLVARAAGR